MAVLTVDADGEVGRVLHGPPPAGLLPPVTDHQLTAFIRHDLEDF
ncbi:hypothetical protein [Streptomyces spinosirectus]